MHFKNAMYRSQFVMLRPDPTASQKNPQPNKLTCGTTNAEKEICLIIPLKQLLQL